MAKPLKIHFFSGTSETFRSLREAAAALGIPPRPLAEALLRGEFPHQSKFQAVYDCMELVELLPHAPVRTSVQCKMKEAA
jgi:hypothetical protein